MLLAKHAAALRRKNKDWLARHQNNVSEWSDISTYGLLCQWASIITIQLSVLVWNKTDVIIISLLKHCWIGVKQLLLTHSLKTNGISSVPFEFDKCDNEPFVCNCLFVQYISQKPVQDMAYARCLIFLMYILLWNSSFVLLAFQVEMNTGSLSPFGCFYCQMTFLNFTI